MKFIDLFAGLGGFHLALKRLGHQCAFACEINEELRTLYQKNFGGFKPEGDIRGIDPYSIPDHDILCAGFPCQPFSKATPTKLRKGFDYPNQGNLFYNVIDILNAKKPQFFILENVLNIKKHDNEQTWNKIHSALKNVGYKVEEICLSPHQFQIPQIRRRIFIVGNREKTPILPNPPSYVEPDLKKFLDKNPTDYQGLTNRQIKCLNIWQEFLDQISEDGNLPQAPIWSMEFGASYPFEEETPYVLGVDELRSYKGNHGIELETLPDDDIWQNIPSYAKRENEQFPTWKRHFIKENRDFYDNNKNWIDRWKKKILEFPPSYQKFEWNCRTEDRILWDLWKYVIQFRASGIRIKKATTAPSLVTMSVHVPIIGWEKRYMTMKECALLQSMPEDLELPRTTSRVVNALGNAVNVDVVERVAKALTSESQDIDNKA